ncbi:MULTISPECIES: hypothetical protein [Tenacibaculum]|uniref:Uncharacterized protein n=2 Tax=Tenacibaculum TaxID=104267 RepID=A0AAE9SFS8_9FLAO|nr:MULTISPECIES: hypothetical protein [Tenacibaculum]GFD73564.1 hypothetical protein KUL113_29840 [Tenacibaculum sp. KUL113]GFD96277.1 hypothetical protein KUL154_50100 [Alteromonas sp. KUL154]GFE01276.1 hypothetical protein KUL156_38680 [Alteromonas sp. KUL156]KAF9658542.1 hypothetical protein HBA12_15330 [Tenacibaculum mesophilum]MCG7502609.1 hypothetical protein [Tenacibaculum sp. Mcav3-52]
MNANPFNICPSCTEINICVLTKFKEKVWSCSEYNEVDVKKEKKQAVIIEKEMQAV